MLEGEESGFDSLPCSRIAVTPPPCSSVMCRPIMWPTQSQMREEQPWNEADPSSESIAEVKNAWS